MRIIALTFLLMTVGTGRVMAQARPATGGNKPRPAAPTAALSDSRPWSLSLGMASVYESNLDHDSAATPAYGAVVAAGVAYQRPLGGGSWMADYEAALHRYALSSTQNSEWNRLSQLFESVFERRIGKRWDVETRGEVSLHGSSTDDRELFNQYALEPRAELRLNSRDRVRFVAAYRVRQYDTASSRNVVAPYAGAEFRQKFEGGRAWNMGLRYEHFDANAARYSFNRWLYAFGYDTPLGARDRLELDLKFRSQSYTERIITTAAGLDELRHDSRWFPSAALIHAIRPGLNLRIDYQGEGRDSNDPDKDFQAHRLVLGANWRW